MSISESSIAQRLLQIKNEAECTEFINWFTSFPLIDWTVAGEEPDVIKALVFNFVLKGNFLFQKRILTGLLKKKQFTSEEIKSLLKRDCQVLLLLLCIDRFNEKNDEDCQAELLYQKPLQVVFTRVITVGSKEAFQKDETN